MDAPVMMNHQGQFRDTQRRGKPFHQETQLATAQNAALQQCVFTLSFSAWAARDMPSPSSSAHPA